MVSMIGLGVVMGVHGGRGRRTYLQGTLRRLPLISQLQVSVTTPAY